MNGQGQTSKRLRILRGLERAFLLFAVLGLGGYTYFWGERHVYQLSQSRRLDRILESKVDKAESIPKGNSADPIGRIEIPRLGLSAVILEGIDEKTLLVAVGHIPQTPLPGEVGNIGLAAHRDTFFRALKDIRRDDVIRLSGPNGGGEYLVKSTAVVEPGNTEALMPSRSADLTLITCYPFNFIGPAPKRFIVKAEKREAGPKAPVSEPAGQLAKASLRPSPFIVAQKAPVTVPVQSPETPPPTPLASEEAGPVPDENGARKHRHILRAISSPLRKSFGWMKPHRDTDRGQSPQPESRLPGTN